MLHVCRSAARAAKNRAAVGLTGSHVADIIPGVDALIVAADAAVRRAEPSGDFDLVSAAFDAAVAALEGAKKAEARVATLR